MRGHFLPVNEIFYSLQGEGLRTGEPSIFLRLSGCNLNCWFCDTDTSIYRDMTISEIMEELRGLGLNSQLSTLNSYNWVVLTGGEPLMQSPESLRELVEELQANGYHIQVETNGTYSSCLEFDHITVSPKEDKINPGLATQNIKEIKLLMQEGDTPRKFLKNIPHFLQPVDAIGQTEKNTAYCRELAETAPDEWRLGLQQHKIWGIK